MGKFLNSTLDGRSNKLYASTALPSAKEPRPPLRGFEIWCGQFGVDKNPLPYTGLEKQFLSVAACS